MNVQSIKRLRGLTGCSMNQCKEALKKCSCFDSAKEYLFLKSQALIRFKTVDGKKVKWQDSDYIKQAEQICDERW